VDRTAFYSTAAQVIQVLWVILVFQLGLFFPSEKGCLEVGRGAVVSQGRPRIDARPRLLDDTLREWLFPPRPQGF
jgi:hypothetical protein